MKISPHIGHNVVKRYFQETYTFYHYEVVHFMKYSFHKLMT